MQNFMMIMRFLKYNKFKSDTLRNNKKTNVFFVIGGEIGIRLATPECYFLFLFKFTFFILEFENLNFGI